MKPTVFFFAPLQYAPLRHEFAQRHNVIVGDDEFPKDDSVCHSIEAILYKGHNPVTAQIIDRFPSLKVIANHGAGYNQIDTKYAVSKGIWVTNTPNVVGPSTADIAVAHMLNVTRRFSESERWLRERKSSEGGWTSFMAHSPEGKTLGIFGLGSIGKQIAKRAKGFDMNVIYHNRNKVPEDIEKELNVRYVDKETLLAESHYIIISIPANPNTYHFLDYNEFNLMRDGVYVINVARGEIIHEQALVDNLKSGKVSGAGLDVYEKEPEVHPDLFVLPNVSLTPHIGTATFEARSEMEELTLKNIEAVLNNQTPPTFVPECSNLISELGQ